MLHVVGWLKRVSCYVLGIMVLPCMIYAVSISEYLTNEKAKDYLKEGHIEKAITVFSELLVNEDIAPLILKNIGDVHLEDENYEKAAETYAQAIPNLTGDYLRDAYYNLGNTYFYKRDFEKAKQAYISALQTDPSHNLSKANLEKVNLLLDHLQKQSQQQPSATNKKKSSQKQQSQKKQQEQNKQELDQKNAKRDPLDDVKKAKQEQEKQKEDNKKRAEAILKQLEKQEQEARKKYLNQKLPDSKSGVEKDW